MKMFLSNCVYVPFSGESIRGVTVNEITAHMALKSCINTGNLSAAVGLFIALRDGPFYF